MRSLFLTVAVLVGLAGCGSEAQEAGPPPTLPAAALPDLESRSRMLDAEAVAADALEPADLADLLDDAGFETGSEREFSGKTTTFDHVVARSLRFGSTNGADAYLGWLRDHGSDILGTAEPASRLPSSAAARARRSSPRSSPVGGGERSCSLFWRRAPAATRRASRRLPVSWTAS